MSATRRTTIQTTGESMFHEAPKSWSACSSGDADGPGVASGTVFIVDDDAAVRDALSLLVYSWGWTPHACASAEEFLECYSRERNACLVLDLQMPGISGADLKEILVELDLDLPTIVITAHPDHAQAARALRAGAVAVVPKPFRHDELLAVIERALATAH